MSHGTENAQGDSFFAPLRDKKRWLGLFLPGLLVTAAMCVLHWSRPDWLGFLDYKVYDTLLLQRPKKAPTGHVVVVDLDEKSLAEVGQWPWPRHQIALLLGRLSQAGVAAVGMDIVFSEPDQTSPARVRRSLAALGVDMDFVGLPEALRDNDVLLARNLQNGPYVLGYFFTFRPEDAASTEKTCQLPPPRLAVRRAPGMADAPLELARATSAVCPLPELSQAGKWAGFFNSFPDHDNIVRWVPLSVSYNGSPYPSLAVATLMRAFGDRGAVLAVEPNPYGGQDMTLSLDLGTLGKRAVPVDKHGRMLLDFRGPARTFPYVSAVDVMRGRAERKALEGKIAFIGTSVRGLEDIRATPVDQSYPGVEAHATAADMILDGSFLRRPLDVWYLELAILAVFGLGVSLQLMLTRALWVGVTSALAGVLMWSGSAWAMNSLDCYVSPLTPLLALAANFTLLTFLKFLREENQKRFIQSAFSHYLSPKVVAEIVSEPGRLTLTGEEKDVSILFSDVRGFTTLSEKLTPTQVVDLLHAYLTPMTRIITARTGTLDKFIGDAVMAFWNAPLDVPGHPAQALNAALDMIAALDDLNPQFQARYGVTIQVGIGLATGCVRVGNFGSEDLFDYTIIGDTVNLCSRLEGLTKFYHLRLLVTQSLRDGAGEGHPWQEVDRVRVKGKHEPVTIHTVRPDAQPGELERWRAALDAYRAADFATARQAFLALAAETGQDLYTLYAERCDALLAAPPAPDWDGVFEHTSK